MRPHLRVPSRRRAAVAATAMGMALVIGSVPFLAHAATTPGGNSTGTPKPGRDLILAVPVEPEALVVGDHPNTTTEVHAVLPSAWMDTACGAARTFAGEEVKGWTCTVENIDEHAVLHWSGRPAERDAGQAPVSFGFRASIPADEKLDENSLLAVRQVYADGTTSIRRAVMELGFDLPDAGSGKAVQPVANEAADDSDAADGATPAPTSISAVFPKNWLGAACGYALADNGDPLDGWSCSIEQPNDQLVVHWLGPADDDDADMLAFGASSQFPGPDFGALTFLINGHDATANVVDLRFRSGFVRTIKVGATEIPGVHLPLAKAFAFPADVTTTTPTGSASPSASPTSDVGGTAAAADGAGSSPTPTPVATSTATPTPTASPASDVPSDESGATDEPAAATSDPLFSNCQLVAEAGYGPYVRGEDPEYDHYEDADNDGIACENAGPPKVQPAAVEATPTPSATPTPIPSATPTPSVTPSGTLSTSASPSSTSSASSARTDGLAAAPGTDPLFPTCEQAVAAGYGPYKQGVDSEYDHYIDADNDGYDCDDGPGPYSAAAHANTGVASPRASTSPSATPSLSATPSRSATPSPTATPSATTSPGATTQSSPSPTPRCVNPDPLLPTPTPYRTPSPTTSATPRPSTTPSTQSFGISPTPSGSTNNSSVTPSDGGPITYGQAPDAQNVSSGGGLTYAPAAFMIDPTVTPSPSPSVTPTPTVSSSPTATTNAAPKCALPKTGGGSQIPILKIALPILFFGLLFLAFGTWGRREPEWPGRYVRR